MKFIDFGTFTYSRLQFNQFKKGNLSKEWYKKYPFLFDDMDIKLADNQAINGYHFVEWLAAVLIWESTGFLSLVEKYQFKPHKRKQTLLSKLVTAPVYNLISNHSERFGNVQCPDLFVYSPDHSEWFFCEVKGPHDKVRSSQRIFFEELSKLSNKEIRLVKFKEI
jgi:hypothetical protein